MRKKIIIEPQKPVQIGTFPTGSTMLNLLLSNSIQGGYPKGKMINMVGDSFSGKTFLLWTLFAELFSNSIYDDYDLYFDEPELSFEINAEELFGEGILDRVIWEDTKGKMIIPPTSKKGKSTKKSFKTSITIEDFGRQAYEVFSFGRPAIYGLDSFDNLRSEKEKPDEDAGYIAARRVRVLNERLRKMFPNIKRTKSLLFVISQVRTNLNVTFGSKKTRSGGNALKHWSSQEMWLAVRKPITKTFRSQKFMIGGEVVVKVTKNRLTGNKGTISFPLDIHYGIDDTTSIIDWLLKFKFWKKKKASSIKSPFGDMNMKKLVSYIEEKNKRIDRLKNEVQESWNFLQEELSNTDRRRKY